MLRCHIKDLLLQEAARCLGVIRDLLLQEAAGCLSVILGTCSYRKLLDAELSY